MKKLNKWVKPLVASLALAFATTASYANSSESQFQQAMNAIKKEDYSSAFQLFNLLAGQGDTKAQFNLGVSYYSGQGVRVDKTMAKGLFSKSCSNGYQKGCDAYRELK